MTIKNGFEYEKMFSQSDIKFRKLKLAINNPNNFEILFNFQYFTDNELLQSSCYLKSQP